MYYNKVHVYKGLVQFEDADSAGFVHHPNYFKYFERSRQAALSEHNCGFEKQLSEQKIFVIADSLISYRIPLTINDTFYIYSQTVAVKKSSLLQYTVITKKELLPHEFTTWRELFNSKEIVTRAQFRLVFVSTKILKPIPISEEILNIMGYTNQDEEINFKIDSTFNSQQPFKL